MPDGNGSRRPTFPRARYVVAEAEWAPVQRGEHPVGTSDHESVLEPLGRHHNVVLIADGNEIAPGVRALVTPGTAPGTPPTSSRPRPGTGWSRSATPSTFPHSSTIPNGVRPRMPCRQRCRRRGADCSTNSAGLTRSRSPSTSAISHSGRWCANPVRRAGGPSTPISCSVHRADLCHPAKGTRLTTNLRERTGGALVDVHAHYGPPIPESALPGVLEAYRKANFVFPGQFVVGGAGACLHGQLRDRRADALQSHRAVACRSTQVQRLRCRCGGTASRPVRSAGQPAVARARDSPVRDHLCPGGTRRRRFCPCHQLRRAVSGRSPLRRGLFRTG